MTPRFFAPGAGSGVASVRLPDVEAHHLQKVLRLSPGDPVSVFDGAGHEWSGVVASAGRGGVTVRLGTPLAPAREPPVAVTLGVGLQKGDRMETIVREATALGVGAIVPLSTAHVAVPARARDSVAARERWGRVALAAVKQCGRATVPDIEPLATPDEVLAAWRGERILMCVEPSLAEENPTQAAGPRPKRVLAMVGPEGGWSDAELQRAVAAGARLLHLGPRSLRADLAPTVLLAPLWATWGWE